MSWDDLRDFLRVDDERLWLLIGVCVGLVLTIQIVEGAVDGVWPHQGRPARQAPRAYAARGAWAGVALLLMPGLVLAVLNLIVLLWQELPLTAGQRLGGFLLGLGWLMFVLAGARQSRVGRYVRELGPVGPVALVGLLVVSDALLLIALLDIVPSWDEVRDAVPLLS